MRLVEERGIVGPSRHVQDCVATLRVCGQIDPATHISAAFVDEEVDLGIGECLVEDDIGDLARQMAHIEATERSLVAAEQARLCQLRFPQQPGTQARRLQPEERLEDDFGRSGQLGVRTRAHDHKRRNKEQDSANTEKTCIKILVAQNAVVYLLEQQRPGEQEKRVVGCGQYSEVLARSSKFFQAGTSNPLSAEKAILLPGCPQDRSRCRTEMTTAITI